MSDVNMHSALGWREGRGLAHAPTHMSNKLKLLKFFKDVDLLWTLGIDPCKEKLTVFFFWFSAKDTYTPRCWVLVVIRDFSSYRQCNWSFTGCHNQQGQQSYCKMIGWFPLPWTISITGRGRQTAAVSSTVFPDKNPCFVLVLFFWDPWEGKTRTRWDVCKNYQTQISVTSTLSLHKFSIGVNRSLFNGFSWAQIFTLIVCLLRVWRLRFIHLNIGIWLRCPG